MTIYWSSRKTNFFIDEFYSMGYARGFTGNEPTARYITESSEWRFENWVDNAELKKQLIITDEGSLRNVSILNGMKLFLTGRNYHGLLNIVESIMDSNGVSNLPAVVLNTVLFVFTQITLWLLLEKLRIKDTIKLLSCSMFGFSAYVISMVEYTRFYMYVFLLMLWILALMLIAWESKNMWTIIATEIGAAVLAYLAYNNSEFAIVYFGLFSTGFVLMGIIRKKWRTIIPYTALGLCGGLYMGLVKGVFGSVNNTLNSFVESSAISSIGSLLYHHSRLVISLFSNMYFGHKVLMFIWFIALLSFYLVSRKKSGRVIIQSEENDFGIMVVISLMLYTLFTTLPTFWVWRYYCFGFLSFIVALWLLVDRIIAKENKTMVVTLVVLTIISSITPFFTKKVEYIYEEDKPFIENISPYVDSNVVYVCPEEDFIYDHGIYDCVNILSDNAQIYAIQENDRIDGETLPNEIILWSTLSTNTGNIIRELENLRYTFTELGEDHVSKAILCTKTKQ